MTEVNDLISQVFLDEPGSINVYSNEGAVIIAFCVGDHIMGTEIDAEGARELILSIEEALAEARFHTFDEMEEN